MQMILQSSLRNDDSYGRVESIFGPLDPRLPIPPRESKEEKRKRIMKEIEAQWARREMIINDVYNHYSQPLRVLGRIAFYKMYPQAKEAQKQQEQDMINWHKSLPPRCIQATSYGEVVGISRLLHQEIPTAFYRTTPKSLFNSSVYYRRDPKKCVFSRGSKHHMEHHKEVNRIVDHPELLASFYHKFLKNLNRIKVDIKQKEQREQKEQKVSGDRLQKQKVTPFPIYVLFGDKPKPCFVHPAFAAYKIGSNPKLPEETKYKMRASLKQRELEIHFPHLRRPRKTLPSCTVDSNTMLSDTSDDK